MLFEHRLPLYRLKDPLSNRYVHLPDLYRHYLSLNLLQLLL